MKRIAYAACLVALIVSLSNVRAHAQLSAAWNLLESPYRSNEVVYAGETVHCSIAYPGTASMFDVDKVTGSPGEFISNELFAPFRVWSTDQNCNMISTWSTAFSGSTMTGIASPNGSNSTYWVLDPISQTAQEYSTGTGVPTGPNLPLPIGGGLAAGLVIDDHQPGQHACFNDIIGDRIICVDLKAAGAFTCSYANPDSPSAFGEGISDAAVPGAGATLVVASGTTMEMMPTRVSQIDCSSQLGPDGCTGYGTWSLTKLPAGTFVSGISEFLLGATPSLYVIDNSFSMGYILQGQTGGGIGAVARHPATIGWWKLDETSGTTAADMQACSDGTHMGMTLPAFVAGKVAGALEFNGSNEVEVMSQPCLDLGPGMLAINSSSMTIEGWIETTSSMTAQSIMQKIGTAPANGYDFSVSAMGTLCFTMDIQKTFGAPSVRSSFSGTIAVDDGVWHHVAITLRRGGGGAATGTFWVDGVLDSTFNALIGTLDGTDPLIIGQGFIGKIDEPTLYDDALTECDIVEIFRAGANGKL